MPRARGSIDLTWRCGSSPPIQASWTAEEEQPLLMSAIWMWHQDRSIIYKQMYTHGCNIWITALLPIKETYPWNKVGNVNFKTDKTYWKKREKKIINLSRQSWWQRVYKIIPFTANIPLGPPIVRIIVMYAMRFGKKSVHQHQYIYNMFLDAYMHVTVFK